MGTPALASLATVFVLNEDAAVTAELPLVDREMGGGGATMIAGGFGVELELGGGRGCVCACGCGGGTWGWGWGWGWG